MIDCHHSCGKIDTLMDDIVAFGPQIILGLFAPYNDQEMVAKKYGDKLVFIGSVNAQPLSMPDVSEDVMRAEARRYTDVFAPTGSLIFNTFMSPPVAAVMDEEFYKIRDSYKPNK
jgi:hypothetical protein